MSFEAPKLPTPKPKNDPNLLGAASLAEKAKPGTVAPKVARLPKINQAPTLAPAPTTTPLPPLPASPAKAAPRPENPSAAVDALYAPPPENPSAAVDALYAAAAAEIDAQQAAEKSTASVDSAAVDALYAPAEVCAEGDPAIAWNLADWDMVLVLPLPEDRAVAAASKDIENAGSAKAAKKAQKVADKADAEAAKLATAAPMSTTPRSGEYKTIDPSEVKLRKGLLLEDEDEAADGCGGKNSGTDWLINELRRRVLMSGLECKVVKLLSAPDDAEEGPGMHEVLSKHNVTLLCVGAAKTTEGSLAASAPPSPPPSPPEDKAAKAEAKAEAKAAKAEAKAAKKEESRQLKDERAEAKAEAAADKREAKALALEGKKQAKAEVTGQVKSAKEAEKARIDAAKAQALEAQRALKDIKKEAKQNIKQVKKAGTAGDLLQQRIQMDARAGERFPRLELEAEKRSMKFATLGQVKGIGGPRAVYRRKAYASFPAFRSRLRQTLEELILTAPLESGRGAGLNLDLLVSSKRVREVIYVHDDDEVVELKNKLLYGSAGFLPLPPATLSALHAYCGGEVSFYFAWTAAYTRSLLIPALVGLLLMVADSQYFNAEIAAERQALFNSVIDGTDMVRQGNQVVHFDPIAYTNTTANFTTVDTLFDGTGTPTALFRAYLTAAFGLLIILWSAGFEETWKRRQALIGFGWGELGADKPPPTVNTFFQARAVKTGFYTTDGLWVELPPPSKQGALAATASSPGFDAAAPKAGLGAEKEPLIPSAPKAPKTPMDVWFPIAQRLRRQYISFALLVAMASLCIASIFFMQLFTSYMATVTIILGGSNQSGTIVSVAKATMIMVFNSVWRAIAIKLSNWENYRLTDRMRENLTYKLFIFQCINCYFMLFFLAFFHPSGALVFGYDLGSCHVRPPPGQASCADNVRSLLYGILFSNIIVGQANEVGIPLFALCMKRLSRGKVKEAKGDKAAAKKKKADEKSAAKEEKKAAKKAAKKEKKSKVSPADGAEDAEEKTAGEEKGSSTAETSGGQKDKDIKVDAAAAAAPAPSAPPSPPPSPPEGGEGGSAELDLDTIVQKKKSKQPLSAAEQELYDRQKVIVDLIAEYERPLVKSVKQGLGNTFYEYNELALQYGYVVLFAVILPAAPFLALVNNIIEFRSDAFKTIYAQRRTRAEPADDIGPWAIALKMLSYAGLFCNLALLMITTDFFDELAAVMPAFETLGARLVVILGVEHLLIFIKLFVDFVVPDVPSKIKVRLAKDEHLAEAKLSAEMLAAEGLELEP